jgi:hypothetical protein
MTGASFN